MQKIIIIFVVIAVLVFLITFAIASIILSKKQKTWKALMDPSNANYLPNDELFSEEKEIHIKKKKSNIKEKFKASAFYKKWEIKIAEYYCQSGVYNKTIDDFIIYLIKCFFIGIMYGFAMYFLFKNILLMIIPSLVIFAVPFIQIYDKITKRRSEFREAFPFFLKTLSFVLQNGANPTTAIVEVTKKLPENTVLREAMEDVIKAQNLNGGNFTDAFKVIEKKVKCEEVNDFIEVIQNNAEKGVSVAETFLNQSDMLSRIINNKKNRKISAVETKILLPILLIMFAVGILVVSL